MGMYGMEEAFRSLGHPINCKETMERDALNNIIEGKI